MKFLKAILIILVVLAAIFVVVGLFLPSKFHAERSLVINAPKEQIFEQINNIKNWNNWNAYNKMDPNWKVTYSDAMAGVGASYTWVSEKSDVGQGKITITKSEPYSYVEGMMEFNGMPPATIGHKLEPQDGGIKVTLTIDSDLGKNITRKWMFGTIGNMMVGKNFEKSLQNLSDYLKSASAPAIQGMGETGTSDTIAQPDKTKDVDTGMMPQTH